MTCGNTKCGKAFTPTKGQVCRAKSQRPAYCCRSCSQYTRNRRYYETLRGRVKKWKGASRYFQRHRYKLYEKRRARMGRYFAEAEEKFREYRKAIETSPEYKKHPTRFDGLIDGEAVEIREGVRNNRDHHPEPSDTRINRNLWEQRHPELVPAIFDELYGNSG